MNLPLLRYRTIPLLCLALAAVVIISAAGDAARAAEGSAITVPPLAGWTSFHEEGAATADVWQVRDGVLVCKGSPKGYLYTEADHKDFVMELEWRWPGQGKAGNGGVLIRTTGPNKIWPRSLEAQLNTGNAGDFWGLDGYDFDGPEDRMQRLEHPQFGKLTNLKKTEDAERPAGQWNHYKITARGPIVTLEVNGKKVNEARRCDDVAGKICLTAEGDEIHFRNVRIVPLEK